MLKGLDSHIEEQLRRAEEAESEVNRLGSLAADAPRLRIELARSQRRQEREGNSQTALQQARREIAAAKERQADVPLTLETVSKLVYSLYSLLKDVEAHRREARPRCRDDRAPDRARASRIVPATGHRQG